MSSLLHQYNKKVLRLSDSPNISFTQAITSGFESCLHIYPSSVVVRKYHTKAGSIKIEPIRQKRHQPWEKQILQG